MHREELKNSDFKQTQLASLQVELGKANSNKASFQQIDLNLRATLTVGLRTERELKSIKCNLGMIGIDSKEIFSFPLGLLRLIFIFINTLIAFSAFSL